MLVKGTHDLTHPALLVFETLRDRTPDLVSIMPNIEGVQELERTEAPPLVHLYNRWQGSLNDVPRVIRPFVRKEMMAWFDRATWDEARLKCTWQIEAVVGRDFFSCAGTTSIRPDGDDRSVFSLDGELRIDPDKLPGVPRFLARRIKDPLEHFIARAMRPNLTSIASAVQRYLDQHR